MKFDQKMFGILIIGIIIGGLAMGLIDANRPKPLFSSANFEAEFDPQGGGGEAKGDSCTGTNGRNGSINILDNGSYVCQYKVGNRLYYTSHYNLNR